jgi:hypothetical protein
MLQQLSRNSLCCRRLFENRTQNVLRATSGTLQVQSRARINGDGWQNVLAEHPRVLGTATVQPQGRAARERSNA